MNKNISVEENIIFFSPIYITFLKEINNYKIKQECYELKNKYPSEKKSNYGGWQSPSNEKIFNIKSLEINSLSKTVESVVKEINILWELDNILMHNFWININKKNNFNRPHNHPQSIFSAVFYVQCNKNSGNLVFERTDSQNYCMPSNTKNKYRYESFWILPEEYKLIIFPSHYKHYVEPNESNQDRISIAFNFGF